MVNKKYAGFTILECLVALVVLSCMCQLFQLMIQQSFIGNQYLKNNDSKSWHIFLIQLEKECQKLVFQTGSAQEISFLDSETNKTISIQIKEDKIIKRVNGKGYQPLLIGIKNGQFKNEGQSFTLEVTFTSGKTFDSFSDKGRILMRQKYSGNLLFTAMAFVYLMSFLALQLLEERQLTQKFTQATQEYYAGKSILHLFLADVKQNRRKLKTEERLVYAQVTLDYTYKNEQLRITVLLNKSGRKYQYQERVSHQKSGNNTGIALFFYKLLDFRRKTVKALIILSFFVKIKQVWKLLHFE